MQNRHGHMTASQSGLLDAVLVAADRLGWTTRRIDGGLDGEHHLLLSRSDGGDPTDAHPVVLTVHDVGSVVVCSSIARQRIAEDRCTAVSEAITRMNSGWIEGKFELDLDDGEVRFTTSAFMLADLSSDQIHATLAHLLSFNVAAFATYAPPLLTEAAGDAPPTKSP